MIRREFMPRVGDTGRDIIASETVDEAKAILGGSDAPTTIPVGGVVGADGVNATRGEDGAITVSLADGGVTAAKIADATIGTDKLTENAVSSLKSIAAKSITADKLADGVIPSAPTWATLAGKPAAAAAKADLTAAPTAADVNAILAVLRAWGLIASK